MHRILIAGLIASVATVIWPAASAEVAFSQPHLPVHTFSIVARDPATGQLGVAVQSHYFAVGTVVPWAEAGVGAVATQSIPDPPMASLAWISCAPARVPPTCSGPCWLATTDGTFAKSR
jgi:Family of unknown function (DUF1028)